MIAGEEVWIEQLGSNDKYEEFFSKKGRRKIRDRIRKIKKNPLRIITKSPIVRLAQKIKPKELRASPRPKASKPHIIQQNLLAATLTPKHLVKSEEELLQDIKEHEDKKNQDEKELEEKEATIVQAKIDADYGDGKQIVSMGAIAVVGFIVLIGVIVYVKKQSRKNQLKALELQLETAKIPTV